MLNETPHKYSTASLRKLEDDTKALYLVILSVDLFLRHTGNCREDAAEWRWKSVKEIGVLRPSDVVKDLSVRFVWSG